MTIDYTMRDNSLYNNVTIHCTALLQFIIQHCYNSLYSALQLIDNASSDGFSAVSILLYNERGYVQEAPTYPLNYVCVSDLLTTISN
ncbi:MAG: hypothetical protein HXO48_02480 [Prevotella sp.]|nr:hypothetical protein [Prevotella sp.]